MFATASQTTFGPAKNVCVCVCVCVLIKKPTVNFHKPNQRPKTKWKKVN